MNSILLFGMPGGGELFIIILVIIMFFGSKKIPELARGLGKGMREIKNATNDIQREIKESAAPLNNVKDTVDIEKQVKDLMKEEEPEEDTTGELTDEEQEKVQDTIKRDSPFKPKNSSEEDIN